MGARTIQDVKASSQGIVVQIKDEEPLEAEILVGTDGVHTQIRKSLAPAIDLQVLPYVVFNGKRRVPNAEFQDHFAQELQNRTVLQSRHRDIVLEIFINESTPKHVDISYTYSRPARQNDPLHKSDRPIPGATDIPEEFYDEIRQLKGLSQPFDDIFDTSNVRRGRVSHWLM